MIGLMLSLMLSQTAPTRTQVCDARGNCSPVDPTSGLQVRDFQGTFWDANTGLNTVSSNTQVLGLSGSGQSYYITDVILSNGGTVQTLAIVSSTTAGNACASSPVSVLPPISAPANGGLVAVFKSPRKVAPNSAVCCTLGGSTAFSCDLHGFTAP